MKRTDIPGLDVTTTRIGFGCASLMRTTSAKGRMRLLEAAYASGIRHFDIARLYGLGAAERELGAFVRGKSDITVATKFGIEPSGKLRSLARFQQPARAFLNRVPAARMAVKRRHETLYEPRRYDSAIARRSLDTSLLELDLDHVDIFFIHDCGPRDDVRTDELVTFFEEARTAGKIRAWGVSQDAYPELDVIDRLGPAALLQIRETILDGLSVSRPHFSFGVLGAALETISSHLASDPVIRRRWGERLGVDPSHGEELARLLFGNALAVNQSGTVLYTTTRPQRAGFAASVLGNPPAASTLEALRGLVTSELSAPAS